MSIQPYAPTVAERMKALSERKNFVGFMVSIGFVLAGVGIAIGLRMALHATVADCPNGTHFPAGTTDYRCYAHRHAGAGTAIVLISAMLAILISLCGLVARAVLTGSGRRGSADDESSDSD